MAADPPSPAPPPTRVPGPARLAAAILVGLGVAELALAVLAAPLWALAAGLDPGWSDPVRVARGGIVGGIALVACALVAVASLSAALGLWRGRRWGYLLAIGLAIAYVPGGFGVLGLGLAWLLQDEAVRAWFRPPKAPVAASPGPARTG